MKNLLVTNVSNITYLTGYSGFITNEREGFVLLTANKTYIFAGVRDREAIEKVLSQKGEFVEISGDNPLAKALQKALTQHKIKQLGFESHDLTVAEHEKLRKELRGVKLVPTIGLIEKLRVVKKSSEISAIEKACRLGDEVFKHVLKKVRTGVTEQELAFEIEYYVKSHHADLSFPTIVAFGANASIPHHQPTNKKLTKNNFVLFDLGTKIDNYCSDMTRTVFFGKPTSEQQKMYETVLEAQTLAIKHLNILISKSPNIPASQVDKVARDYIVSKGFQTIPHSLGHGTGLEIHEAPRLSPKSKDILKPGMVFSIEPGIYRPGFGGVRIEDLVVLETKGPHFLTKSPRQLLVIY